MLTQRQVATLRAALLFWQEEMSPHGEATMQPYYDEPGVESLSAAEVVRLRDQLLRGLRFALYDPQKQELYGRILYRDRSVTEIATGELKVATVILPPIEN